MSITIGWEMTVILLVAVTDEFAEVQSSLRRKAIAEAASPDPSIARLYFLLAGDVLMRVLLAKLPEPSQGGDAAGWLTAMLAERYRPYCLAMVGLCAGDPGRLEHGDVVVASATVRHDFGKLRWDGSGVRPRLTHRRELCKLDAKLTTRLLETLDRPSWGRREQREGKRGRPCFSVRLGVLSSGNQVVRAVNTFDYLNRNVAAGLQGDEYNRTVIGLDMEAHPVAYAAVASRVPLWFVAKGVADYADLEKCDLHRAAAMRNAYGVTMAVLRDLAVERFLQETDRGSALIGEKAATECFARGDISGFRAAAESAHARGRRSPAVRRRYLHALAYSGGYERVQETLAEYRQSRVLYDDVALEVEATLFWRLGEYAKARALLTDDVIAGRRELTYLRGMTEVFLGEGRVGGPEGRAFRRSVAHLKIARTLLKRALRMRTPAATPWWIQVNLYWVCRLLGEEKHVLSSEFDQAQAMLVGAMADAPQRGSVRLYHLMLLAIADREAEFRRALDTGPQHLEMALGLVDMVYERLVILHQRGLLLAHERYWAGICSWLRRTRTVGKTVRERTAHAMR